jgi:hypothetical protein
VPYKADKDIPVDYERNRRYKTAPSLFTLTAEVLTIKEMPTFPCLSQAANH